MSWGLKATILLTLTARKGEWVPITTLAERSGLKAESLADDLDELVDANQIQHASRDGQPVYGLACEGVTP